MNSASVSMRIEVLSRGSIAPISKLLHNARLTYTNQGYSMSLVKLCFRCMLLFTIIQVGSVVGAEGKDQEITDRKVLSILEKLDRNLNKLEGFVDTAIPAVPLKSVESKQSQSYFKRIESSFKKLNKSYPDVDVSMREKRFASLKAFFENKEKEAASPAASDIRNMVMHILYLETDADKRRESASRNFYTEAFKASEKLAAAEEKDPDYDFSVLKDRFAPHAEKFVQESGYLLPHLPGFAEQKRANDLQNSANAYIYGGAALSYKEQLDKMAVEIEKSLLLSKEKAPDYYQPVKAEAQLDFMKQVLAAAERNELRNFDNIETACQQENIGKIVFANKKLEDNCDSSSFITSYEVGKPLYMRAAFEDIASNAYVKMREHARTPGVHQAIKQRVVYSIDGKEVYSFIPKFVQGELTRPATTSVLMDADRIKYRELYLHFDEVLLDMVSAGKDKATFGIAIYAYNTVEQAGVPKDGPLLAKGELLIDLSSSASKQFLRDGKLAISTPGSLDDEMHEMVEVALVRNKVEYDLFHVTSDQATIVKNVLGIPLKRVVRTVIVNKSSDNRCTAYAQWMKQVFDGTGYTQGFSLDKKEHSKNVSCSSVEQYL